MAEQLRDALAAQQTRVIDLFKDWDDDASGTVSKQVSSSPVIPLYSRYYTISIESTFWDHPLLLYTHTPSPPRRCSARRCTSSSILLYYTILYYYS